MRRGHPTAKTGRQVPTASRLEGSELRILELWSRGASTTEVAGRLGLPERDVDDSTSRILRKLGVHSRIEAVAHGLTAGLVGSRSRSA